MILGQQWHPLGGLLSCLKFTKVQQVELVCSLCFEHGPWQMNSLLIFSSDIKSFTVYVMSSDGLWFSAFLTYIQTSFFLIQSLVVGCKVQILYCNVYYGCYLQYYGCSFLSCHIFVYQITISTWKCWMWLLRNHCSFFCWPDTECVSISCWAQRETAESLPRIGKSMRWKHRDNRSCADSHSHKAHILVREEVVSCGQILMSPTELEYTSPHIQTRRLTHSMLCHTPSFTNSVPFSLRQLQKLTQIHWTNSPRLYSPTIRT